MTYTNPTPDQIKFLRKMKQMQKLRRMAYDLLNK